MKKKLFTLLGALLFSVVSYSVERVHVGGISFFLNTSASTATVAPLMYSGDIVIPESFVYDGKTYTVTHIQGEANSVVAQMEGYDAAFRNCVNLTSVTIPKSIKGIGRGAFKGCTSLKAVYISDLKSWCDINYSDLFGSDMTSANPLYYAHDLYLNGEKISDLVISDDIKTIGAYSFVGGSFKSVTFGKEFEVIGEYSFANCVNLKDVYCYSANIPCEPVEWYFQKPEEKTLHIRERYKDNYFNIYQAWDKFGKIEYIEEMDYHLKYIVDGSEHKNVWYEVGETITPEAEPTKEGYTFSGWSEIPKTMPDHDVMVTGNFSINTYKLTYYVDEEEYKVADIKFNDAITLESEPTRKGMTFSGWSGIPEIMPAKDIEVKGSFSWSKKTIDNVIYEVSDTIGNYCKAIGNENASGAIKIADAVDFDYSYNMSTIADNTFNGCKGITTIDMPSTITSIGERAFAGIDKLTDVTIRAEEIPATDRTAFENSYIEDYVTLHVPGSAIKKYKDTAPWKNFKEIVAIPGTEANETYKLTYMVDGEVYKTVDVKEGDVIKPEDLPTKEGYTFSGWGDLPSVMPSQDVIVSGTFTINKYKLVYMVDGEVYRSYDVEYRSAITAEAVPTKVGYTFSGWSEIPNTMPANDVTITGAFTVNKYKLIYMVDNAEYKTYDIAYGSAITPEAAPTKEGYTFSGWDYVPGVMPSSDVTVTGYFTVNRYTITYYVDGEVYKTVEVEYGSVITPESEPSKEGYNFSGWSWIPSKMPAEDVTVTGSFTKITYQVGNSTYEMNEDGVTLTRGEDVNGVLIIDAFVTINGKRYKVTVIGEGAFQGFSRIKSVTIPDGIESVMADAFEGCSGIMRLILGKNVRYIGHRAFANASRYADARTRAEEEQLIVECHSESVPEAEEDCFDNTPIEAGLLLVNDNLFYSYDATSPWNQFGNIMGFDQYTGVVPAFTDDEGATLFSIDGHKLEKPQKGINIIKTQKGFYKVMLK